MSQWWIVELLRCRSWAQWEWTASPSGQIRSDYRSRRPSLCSVMCHGFCVWELTRSSSPPDRSECVEKKDAPEVFFCCCEGSLCNDKFFYSPDSSQPQIPSELHLHLFTICLPEIWIILIFLNHLFDCSVYSLALWHYYVFILSPSAVILTYFVFKNCPIFLSLCVLP